MLILNIFLGLLCQPLQENQTFSTLSSSKLAVNFDLVTYIYIYIYIYKTFALLLIAPEVSRKSLICWCWVWSVICLIVYPESSLISLVNLSAADFGVYSVDQCNQNQVKGIFGVSFLLIALFVFFLLLTFVLQRVTLSNNFCSFPNLPCSQPTKFG